MSHLPQQAIGQKLMLAFEGTEPPADVLTIVRERDVGGFTLFRPLNVVNPAQVRALTDRMQAVVAETGRPPLLFATDQEGGQLMAMGADTTQFPGNMALGATRDADLAQRVGYAIGCELRAMGINVNYAPICDINTNPDNPSLGIRAFSDDPAVAESLAAAMVAGLQAAGVAATLKHFPGKGAADVDSHYQMPVIRHSRERLDAAELRPFKAGIAAGARLIMTGHFAIPALMGTSQTPATLSRAVMHGFLREALGFEGVVITDALDMGAITQGVGQIIDVIAAVRAGVDLLLLTSDPDVRERLYAGLKLAYTRGLIEDHHLRPSVARILALKVWAAQQPQHDSDCATFLTAGQPSCIQ